MVAVTIEINPRMIERVIYWIVIIILAGLLIASYMSGDSTTEDTDSAPAETAAPPAQETAPPPAPTATATCDDGKKNQDETDVDCGGSCGTCAAGKTCTVAADCAGGYCNSNKCASAPPTELSGDLTIQLTDIRYQKSGSGSVKVTGIDYKITNGRGEDTGGLLVKLYVKNKAGTRCLNQQTSGTCDDSYAEFLLSSVKSGKTLTDGHNLDDGEYTTLMGRYLIPDTGYDYEDPSHDDFTVQVYLYDANGNEIGGKSTTTFLTKNPT